MSIDGGGIAADDVGVVVVIIILIQNMEVKSYMFYHCHKQSSRPNP
jgi:hypothetical protein